MSFRRRLLNRGRALLAVWFVLLTQFALLAQETAVAPHADLPRSAAAIRQRIEAVRAAPELDDAGRTLVIGIYERAIEHAQRADELSARRDALRAEIDNAPTELARVRAELAAEAQSSTLPATASLDELERALERARQLARSAEAALETSDTRATQRIERQSSIPARLAQLRGELETIEQELDTPPAGDQPPLQTEARRTRLLAQQLALVNERDALETELAHIDATAELATTQRDLAARRATLTSRDADALQERVQNKRATEAAVQAELARRAAASAGDSHPLVRATLIENSTLFERLQAIAVSLQSAELDQAQAQADLRELERSYQETKKRVDQVGLTEGIGALLRQKRNRYPDTGREYSRKSVRRHDQIAELQLARFDVEDRRAELFDLEVVARERVRAAEPAADPERVDAIVAELSPALEAQRRTLDDLLARQSQLFEILVQLDTEEHRILTLSTQFLDYINERVLWIRSAQPIWQMPIADVIDSARWMCDASRWRSAFESVVRGLARVPLAVLGLLVALGLMLSRRSIQARLVAAGEIASKPSTLDFRHTTWALVWTALLAAPLPMILGIVGGLLASDPLVAEFDQAIAVGMLRFAWIFATLRFVQLTLRPSGLGESHFLWRDSVLSLVRKRLRWLIWIVVPATFVVASLNAIGDATRIASLGRLTLITGLLGLTVFLWRILHPTAGLPSRLGSQSLLQRWSRLFFALGVAAPLCLLYLAVVGYGYTALQLVQRLEATLALFFAFWLLYSLIVRAFFLARRRILIAQAKERVRIAREQAQGKGRGEDDAKELPIAVDTTLDPMQVAQQSARVLQLALGTIALSLTWFVWVDVLPALGALRGITISTDLSVEPPTVITLADLLLSILVLSLTILIAHNVPGFLELAVLRRFAIHTGARHAVTTLARYATYAIGFVAAFSAIGIGWGKVQWLVAAISVGLGFGLQEIFANFVSGLILLFEQPVRVGDTITVGDSVGRVARIRIRATTLVDWDRRELVVPNREFVTSRFINWTLTDSVMRLKIPVGVAYGSDTEQARALLLEAAHGCPGVIADPPPRALFMAFGASSLDLELWVYINNLDELSRVRSELHTVIDKRFAAHGIEIAFPQRDLHLRTVPEFVARLAARANPATGAEITDS